MRTIKYIVLHCTATSQTTTIESIKRFWREKLGWKNVGYHYIIKADGEIVQLADLNTISNGVKGHNRYSVHIAYIGGVEKGKAVDNRTVHQKASQVKLLRELQAKYPTAEILGHRDLSPDLNGDGIISPHEWTKECPSFDVKQWLKEINF
ncbi:N-acetylmuramoyl-L-alanine amidase [Riemerella anatipestifer]|uniref:N-acetylmuramoyl-L-alanine amidase n=1 Tax=Riemerella anatipestifer RA-CH-1 TaxID=1228997 RepID=J9R7T8_RIEAN|nr:N-acetylmuramoyl-L-alanine amidase [Riemerella anatipestifer]AFR36553.1 Negative regulator of beta-lactamase expression [Riemerella anatipestifer RA-CH-1]AIH01347.1 N-acetylmuramoyl-L-alanine amidase family 2 [Riemerella anatipestifer CH3]MBT0557100.1 N-acetylmuramoyl-L-alanine amidase [Riemerella anatipestifer]MCO7331413.1 N-acetylmuramoyl-L-alanine amidase [Riemerella anatipestifer]MCO7350116.1 N-acetylmuramoyl-L-alanine amidase [Riemerella anatipestifer]